MKVKSTEVTAHAFSFVHFLRSLSRLFYPLMFVGVFVAFAFYLTSPSKVTAQRAPSPALNSDINRAEPSGQYVDDFVPGEVLLSFQPGTARGKKDSARQGLGAASRATSACSTRVRSDSGCRS